MVVQFFRESDMDLRNFSSSVLKYLLDEGIEGVGTEKVFFSKYLLYQHTHNVRYNSLHRDGGLTIYETQRLVNAIFDASITKLSIDYYVSIGRCESKNVFLEKTLDFEDLTAIDNGRYIEAAVNFCIDVGIGEYILYGKNDFILSDGVVRAYPCNKCLLSSLFQEVKRFISLVKRQRLQVTDFTVDLETDASLYTFTKYERDWLF